jgi:hypothetical protein
VKLARETAGVAGIGEELGHEDFVGWNVRAVLAHPSGPGIAPGEKAAAAR